MIYLTAFNTARAERTTKPRATRRSFGSLLLSAALASLAASGCSEDSKGNKANHADKANDAGKADAAEPEPEPAVVVGNRVCGPDNCTMYLGAFPEVPSGELDRANMREFGGILYITVFDGRVYSYDRESAKLTKFDIANDYLLESAGELSFEDFGAIGSPAWTQVVSATRAFSFLSQAETIVVWNPSTMEMEQEIPTSEFVREGIAPDANPPVVAGGRVLWPLQWVDFDDLKFDSHAAVLSLDPETLEVKLLEDDRAAVTSVVYAAGGDDTLVLSNNMAGYLNLFGDAAGKTPADAVLKVRNGRDFDADYRVDLREATGSPALYGGWFLGDNAMLLRVWDPDVDPASVLTEPSDFWNAEEFVSMMLVDLKSGKAERFKGLPKGGAGSTGDPTTVDGKVYIAVYSDDQSRSEMFAVTTEGAKSAFSTLGDVLFMERAR